MDFLRGGVSERVMRERERERKGRMKETKERERRCWVCGGWNGGGPVGVLNKKQCQQNHMLLLPIHYFSPNMSCIFSFL